MAYEKRICILKQLKKGFSADGSALSGVVYAERMGGDLAATLRIPGLSALKEGRYVLVLQIAGKKFCLPADGPMRIEDAPSVKSGFAALLCFVRSEPEPVAFGCCGTEQTDAKALLAALSDTGRKKPLPTPMPPNQIPSPPAPNVPYAPGVPLPEVDPPKEASPFRERAAAYDDEAIADSDYYAASHAHEGGNGTVQGQAEEVAGDGDPSENEDALLFPRGSLTYYKEVRDEIETVLKSYPADMRLKWAFPQSEWARNGDSLIGIVYEEGIPRYLCVASEKPDDDLKEHSVFVPASPFSDETGFYVVFQDADTGAYVKVENS